MVFCRSFARSGQRLGQQAVRHRRHRHDAQPRQASVADVSRGIVELVGIGQQALRFAEEGHPLGRQRQPALAAAEQLAAELRCYLDSRGHFRFMPQADMANRVSEAAAEHLNSWKRTCRASTRLQSRALRRAGVSPYAAYTLLHSRPGAILTRSLGQIRR